MSSAKGLSNQIVLRPRQIEAQKHINAPGFKNILNVLPTSYGKTEIAKMVIRRSVSEKKRAVYISPLKSLTSEQTETFSKEWKVKEITKDTKTNFDYDELKKFNVFIFTYEKLESILLSRSKRDLFFEELKIGCIIIDEIHNIADPSRGANLEMVIVILMVLYPKIHICGLSATIGNPEPFSKWLGANLVYAGEDERPVPLKKEIVEYSDNYGITERTDIIRDYLNKYQEAKVLIFCRSRALSEGVANRIAIDKNHHSAIKARNIDDDKMQKFEEMIKCNTCYHNAGLHPDIKKFIEKEYKKNKDFKVLASTTTLAQGVNLPADICFLFDTTRYDYLKSTEYIMPTNEIHQMLGRAGRYGISKFGLAVVMVQPRFRQRITEILEKPTVVVSQLEFDLKRKILEVLTSFVKKEELLYEVFQKAFSPINKEKVKKALDWLVENKFVEREEDGYLKIQKIGVITAYAFIQPETTLHLIKVHEEIKNMEFKKTIDYIKSFDLILNQPEFCEVIIVRNNKNDNNCLYIAAKYYQFSDDRISKAFAMTFLDQIKIDNDLEKDDIKISTGEQYTLKEACNRFILAAYMLFKDDLQTKKHYKSLHDMVSSSFFDLELMKLSNISGIGTVRLRRLVERGIKSLETFLETDAEELATIMKISKGQALKMLEEGVEEM